VAGRGKDWFCYMVRCKDGAFYVGMTNDLQMRIREHNWGVKSQFTAKRRPVSLVWFEKQADRSAARSREKEIKGWRREKKLRLMEGFNPSPAKNAGSG
jgi:predicted GIY-YIG superfamily endonuclease